MSEKGKKLKELLNTPDYQDWKAEKDKTQKRREKTHKFTSIANSTDTIRNLIIANVALFLISLFVPSIMTNFALYPMESENFRIYQILTSMFLHGNFLHLGFNMFMLWSFGNQLEQFVGNKKFLQLYFITGIISSIFWMSLGMGPAVGASGALCGLFAAYIFIAPEAKVLLFFIIPLKIKYAVYGFGAFSLVFGLLSLSNPSLGFGIAHFAHLGGMVSGYTLTYYWRKNNMIQPTM